MEQDARISNLEENEGNDNITAEIEQRVSLLEQTTTDHENQLLEIETVIEGTPEVGANTHS